MYKSEHIENTMESVSICRQESVHGLGNARWFRSGDEQEQDGQYREAQGDQICLALPGHFIVTEEPHGNGTEEGDDQTGKGENAEKHIGHQETDEEDRQENEGQVVGNGGLIDLAAHIVQPVCRIKTEETEEQEGEEHHLVPDSSSCSLSWPIHQKKRHTRKAAMPPMM